MYPCTTDIALGSTQQLMLRYIDHVQQFSIRADLKKAMEEYVPVREGVDEF